MKKRSILYTIFLLISITIPKSYGAGNPIGDSDNPIALNPGNSIIGANSNKDSEYSKFQIAAKNKDILYRKINGIRSSAEGYYAISGVFGNQENANKAIGKLRNKGFDANFLTNPKDKLHYVYLRHSADWRNIVASCSTKFNGKYPNAVWILFLEGTKSITKNVEDMSIPLKQKASDRPIPNRNDSLVSYAKKNKIATRAISELGDVSAGYYIITGVFSDDKNAQSEVKKLKRKGFGSEIIINPTNQINYVYLKKYDDWRIAVDACVSKFNGTYTKDVWVLDASESRVSVDNNENFKSDSKIVPTQEIPMNSDLDAKDTVLAVEDVTYDMLSDVNNTGAENYIAAGNPNKSKLIQKADHYFGKMWYAEAAELYEEALEKDENNYSFEVIQKAGDAHYFNTNMEKALYWYDILYNKYGKDMSADNIFKYAHSLKGTGKYARAKRLMRLYNRKMRSGEVDGNGDIENNPTPNEVVLDRILGTEKNFDIKNMAVNTKYSDFAPMFLDSNQIVFASAKDSSIFNTRRYKWNEQPYLDLYVAKMNEESQDLKDAVKFSKKINTKYHEAAVTFSPDNSTMYFTRNNFGKKLKRDKKGVNHLKIYMSQKVNGEWTEAVEVPFDSDNYSTGHPALSPDGKKLYFVSDMPGSIGETDIFVVDVLAPGRFSEPRNLGPSINTERKEMFPFINGKKLYFSSDGHTGLGGLDVYEVAYDETGFKEVINVGQPVNSKKDDFSYIVNEKTQKGFFASNRAGGKGDDDIYSFKRLVLEELPMNKNAITGVVTELITGNIMPRALVQLLDENNIKLKEVVAEDDGSFVFEDLDDNTKYTIKTTYDKFFDAENQVTTTSNDTINVNVSMKRLQEMIAIEDGIKKLKTEMIHFDFDRYNIRPDASKELDKLVKVMNEYPDMVIKIESHTDSRGKKIYNRYLSNSRAKATRDYIISRGISADRIESAIGYGEDRLLNECDGSVVCTEQKHYLNRRSEFIIVKM